MLGRTNDNRPLGTQAAPVCEGGVSSNFRALFGRQRCISCGHRQWVYIYWPTDPNVDYYECGACGYMTALLDGPQVPVTFENNRDISWTSLWDEAALMQRCAQPVVRNES